MTIDIPKNIETNIRNLLSSERDHDEYIFEYVRLVFSNPNLTAKRYQENGSPDSSTWFCRRAF